MRGWAWALVVVVVVGCDDGAGDGDGGVDGCNAAALVAQCPPGSNPQVGALAESQCSGAAGAVFSDGTGAAVGNCVGTNVCQVACEWAAPCLCGVASVTREGVDCLPCDPDRACGNGTCDAGESPEICPIDCGARCAPDETRCGSDGVREMCNLQGVWEQVACAAGEICAVEGGEATCVPDVIGPQPDAEPGPQPDPEPEGDNRCWTFGPGDAPSDGQSLGQGDCRDLEWKGLATGPVLPGGEYMVGFDDGVLFRRPLDAADFAQIDAAIVACEPDHAGIRGNVARRRVPHAYQRDTCILAALTTQCGGDDAALNAALDACAAVEEAHLPPEALGLDPEIWPLETFAINKVSPFARYRVLSWKSYPRRRDDTWNLAVIDQVDGVFRPLALPAGYTIEHTQGNERIDWTDFSLDERLFAAVVIFESDYATRAVAIWTLATGEVRLILPDLEHRNETLRMSPDGRFLIMNDQFIDIESEQVFATFRCNDELAGLQTPPGMRRTGHYHNAWPLGAEDPELDRARLGLGVYSPDGTSWITQGPDGLELWDVATASRLRILGPGAGRDEAIRMTADCSHLTIGAQLYGPAE